MRISAASLLPPSPPRVPNLMWTWMILTGILMCILSTARPLQRRRMRSCLRLDVMAILCVALMPHSCWWVCVCVCVGHPSCWSSCVCVGARARGLVIPHPHNILRARSLSLYVSASISLSFYISPPPAAPLVNSSELIYVFARVPVCVRARVRLCMCVAVGGCLHACNIQVFLMRQRKRRCNPNA